MALVLRYELVTTGDWVTQDFGDIFKHIRLRHIAGADDAEITFYASGTTAQVMLSSSGGSPYAQEVQMEFHEGFDRVRVKSASPDATIEVVVWR